MRKEKHELIRKVAKNNPRALEIEKETDEILSQWPEGEDEIDKIISMESGIAFSALQALNFGYAMAGDNFSPSNDKVRKLLYIAASRFCRDQNELLEARKEKEK